MRAVLLSAIVTLVAAAPAAATSAPDVFVLAAYGDATTTCAVTLETEQWTTWGSEGDGWPTYRFTGRTDCTAPVQQSGEAWLTNDDPSLVAYAWPCELFGPSCESTGSAGGYQTPYADHPPGPVKYHVRLRAPLGQGWATAPDACSGVGTDNLDCTFTSSLAHVHSFQLELPRICNRARCR